MRDSYDTREEAEADGWTKYPPTGWTKRDTSGGNSFGYEFTATSPDGTKQDGTAQALTSVGAFCLGTNL